MRKYGVRIRLYIESMLPFFLLSGIYTVKKETLACFVNEPFIGAVYHFITGNSFAGIMLLMALIIFIVMAGKRETHGDLHSVNPNNVADIKSLHVVRKYSYWLFFATYIVPSVLVYRYGFKGKLLTFMIILIIGIISIYSDLFYRNPVLWLLGYRLYNYDTDAASDIMIVEGSALKDKYGSSNVDWISAGDAIWLLPNRARLWRCKQIWGSLRRIVAKIICISERVADTIPSRLLKTWRYLSGYIIRHPMVTSLVYSTAIMIFMWIGGMMRWEGADDFTMSQLLMGTSGSRTPYILTSSYFFGEMVVWLQENLPVINWFTGLEIFSVWSSFAIFEWFLLKNAEKRRGYMFALLFPVIAEPLYFLFLQYTRSAFLLPFAGIILFYEATISDLYPLPKSDDKSENLMDTGLEAIRGEHGLLLSTIKCLIGLVLFVFGSQFRYSCFFAGVAYSGIFFATFALRTLRQKQVRKYLARLFGFCAVTLIAVFSTVIIHKENMEIYDKWDETNGYRKYNKTRSEVTEYLPSEYSENISLDNFEISYNDWLMINFLAINDDVFSKEYLEQAKKNLDVYKKTIDKKTSITWNLNQLFYYRSGRTAGQQNQYIICLFICFIGLIISSRKEKLPFVIDVSGTAIFLVYFLVRQRLPSWVADPIYLFGAYVSLVYICSNDFTEPGWLNRNYNVKEYVVGTILLLCLAINLLNVRHFSNISDYENDEDIKELIQYVETQDNAFILDNAVDSSPYPYIDVYGVLYCFEEGQWDNIIRAGNWDIEHPERNRQKESLGIDSVIYSLSEGETCLITTNNHVSFDMYRKFFKEHYGLEVYFIRKKTFGDYGIYSCRVCMKI